MFFSDLGPRASVVYKDLVALGQVIEGAGDGLQQQPDSSTARAPLQLLRSSSAPASGWGGSNA